MVGFFFIAGVKHFLLTQPFKKRYILIYLHTVQNCMSLMQGPFHTITAEIKGED